MSIEFAFRIMGMFIFAVLGARFGVSTADAFNLPEDANGLIFLLLGSLVGLITTPWITTRPATSIRRRVVESPIENLVSSLAGLGLGIFVGLLMAYPLSQLPDLFGLYMPTIAMLVLGYFGITIFSIRSHDIYSLTKRILGRADSGGIPMIGSQPLGILIDTSVIIDGRILEMSKTGFLPGALLIPQFVLGELQNIANSSDPMRRQRGRHGLDVLNSLKQDGGNVVQVIDDDPTNITEVDAKLVDVAKERNVPLMTNDFNLNGVANVHGVTVLNVNELSLALQPNLLPGETIYVQVISEGREVDQGVGYLSDGTMVVVEGGKRYLDRKIQVEITRYIRSTAGKMYFGQHAASN